MINKILISRIQRVLKYDPHIPLWCNSKWFYVDITEKCDCIDTCKYNHLNSRQEWSKHADDNYKYQIEVNKKKYNNN